MLGFISYNPSVTTIRHTNIIRNTLVNRTHQLIFSSSIIESTDPIDRRRRGTILSNDTAGGSPCPLPKVSWCSNVLILRWKQARRSESNGWLARMEVWIFRLMSEVGQPYLLLRSYVKHMVTLISCLFDPANCAASSQVRWARVPQLRIGAKKWLSRLFPARTSA